MPHQSDMNERKDMTTNQNRGDAALLPCPFCGGKPYLGSNRSYFGVKCCVMSGNHLSEADAIRAWNTRTENTALQLRVTSLEGALIHCGQALKEAATKFKELDRPGHALMAEQHALEADTALSPSGPQEA